MSSFQNLYRKAQNCLHGVQCSGLKQDEEIKELGFSNRTIEKIRLKGISEGHVDQLLAQSRANFRVRRGCSGTCSATFWKSLKMGIPHYLWAARSRAWSLAPEASCSLYPARIFTAVFMTAASCPVAVHLWEVFDWLKLQHAHHLEENAYWGVKHKFRYHVIITMHTQMAKKEHTCEGKE